MDGLRRFCARDFFLSLQGSGLEEVDEGAAHSRVTLASMAPLGSLQQLLGDG